MSTKPLRKILYAEDEPDIREIAKIALEDIGGFSVVFCTNGSDVLVQAKNMHPDLLLLDVMMPEMDGPTTLKELRKLPKFDSLPTIFMTAKIQPDEIAKYKAMGVLDVITKPFDPMTLAENLNKIWERYNELCQTIK